MPTVFENDVFPSNSKLLFRQTTAPLGWAKITTYNNYGIRVVTGATGGTAPRTAGIAFTTALQSYSVISDSTSLLSSDNPDHFHNSEEDTGGSTRSSLWQDDDNDINTITSASVGGSVHSHGTSTVNLSISYIDVIIANKEVNI